MSRTLEQRRAKQAQVFDRIEQQNRGQRSTLIRKQVSGQQHWQRVWAGINAADKRVHERATALIDEGVRETELAMATHGLGATPVYGWSGGKDSLALELVMDAAGIGECCFVITELEWPAFLAWATDRMPDGCSVVHRAEINLRWLNSHPDLLFPPDANASAKWFSAVQHTGQQQYLRGRNALMFLGRRKMDGNVTGTDGYTESKRGRFFNPIREWTHEDVLMVLKVSGKELPPTYGWPRGYQVGTGPWPARQFCRGVEHGWGECWQIDQDVVRQAARFIPSGQSFMLKYGLA
jgi:3'-phosphoadenosine 5'-phosphosulfate sulfotransferase (PAPS reductase)/FAD synthetase